MVVYNVCKMSRSTLIEFEKIFKAVANKRRLQILLFLKLEKEATVGAIAEHIRLSVKSTSRHLSVLYLAGIV